MQQQLWNARKPDGTLVSTLLDGLKYLLGVKWLPTGWEIGWVPSTVRCTVLGSVSQVVLGHVCALGIRRTQTLQNMM